MRVDLSTVIVQDQDHALWFYTEVLGFVPKLDLPLGEYRWLTVVSPDQPEGTQLVLEPAADPASANYQSALFEAGIPLTSFAVDDVEVESQRLMSRGVRFTREPQVVDTAVIAVFDDTCGNLIQLHQAA